MSSKRQVSHPETTETSEVSPLTQGIERATSNLRKAGCASRCAACDAPGTRGAPVGGMAKQRARVLKISKLTGTDGSAVVDFETGILIGVSNDDAALARTSQRDDSSAERFWQPRSNPNPKLSRN